MINSSYKEQEGFQFTPQEGPRTGSQDHHRRVVCVLNPIGFRSGSL
jgi:hypothetical protein